MRLRLLKLSCLFLVLALAGGLVLFDFAGDDLQSALVQTSSVTPARDLDVSAAPEPVATAPNPATPDDAAASAAPTAVPIPAPGGSEQPAASQLAGDVPVPGDTARNDTPVEADAQAQSAAPPDQAPASVTAVEGRAFPNLNATLAQTATAPASVESVAPAPTPPARSDETSVASAAAGGSTGAPAAVPASDTRSAVASADTSPPQPADQPAKPPGIAHKHSAIHLKAPVPAARSAAAEDAAAYQVASTVTPTARPPTSLLAQTPPPVAPIVPTETRNPPPSAPFSGSQFGLGLQTLVEFPSLQSTASGSLAGAGSVTNSSSRVIPGLVGSWTSAPLTALPLTPSLGGSIFLGAPASGDSVASAATSGGYTLKLGQTNMWPVIMPRFFMGVPLIDGTHASLGTGVWINNVKETATIANGTTTQTDEHSGVTVRPFLNAAITQHAPLLGFLPADSQELKFSGGYIFGDTNFQAAFCAAGQTCVKTADQGSWFLGLSFQIGFPAGGGAER